MPEKKTVMIISGASEGGCVNKITTALREAGYALTYSGWGSMGDEETALRTYGQFAERRPDAVLILSPCIEANTSTFRACKRFVELVGGSVPVLVHEMIEEKPSPEQVAARDVGAPCLWKEDDPTRVAIAVWNAISEHGRGGGRGRVNPQRFFATLAVKAHKTLQESFLFPTRYSINRPETLGKLTLSLP